MSARLIDPLIPGTLPHALYSPSDRKSTLSGCVYIIAPISPGFREFGAFLGMLELCVVDKEVRLVKRKVCFILEAGNRCRGG